MTNLDIYLVTKVQLVKAIVFPVVKNGHLFGDIYLVTKVQQVKAVVFPVVMNACEGWTTEELMLLNCGVGKDS